MTKREYGSHSILRILPIGMTLFDATRGFCGYNPIWKSVLRYKEVPILVVLAEIPLKVCGRSRLWLGYFRLYDIMFTIRPLNSQQWRKCAGPNAYGMVLCRTETRVGMAGVLKRTPSIQRLRYWESDSPVMVPLSAMEWPFILYCFPTRVPRRRVGRSILALFRIPRGLLLRIPVVCKATCRLLHDGMVPVVVWLARYYMGRYVPISSSISSSAQESHESFCIQVCHDGMVATGTRMFGLVIGW